MFDIPTINIAQTHATLEEEINRLQAMLIIERDAKHLAEEKLLEIKELQYSSSPPSSHMAIIVGLAKLAESRDDDTGKHLARIRHYTTLIATAVAKAMPALLSEREVAIIGATSVLHDIGKVGIPDSVLLCEEALSDEAFTIMKAHTCIGGDILLALSEEIGRDSWIDVALQITLGHHERWNGTGYPFGLKGQTINLPARIVAVADAYDAITQKRVYKEAEPHELAVRRIKDASGTQFDPMVVEAFINQEQIIQHIAKRLQSPAYVDVM